MNKNAHESRTGSVIREEQLVFLRHEVAFGFLGLHVDEQFPSWAGS